jgi:hypothetical protein
MAYRISHLFMLSYLQYGPFPHPTLTIFNNLKNGGMEYGGAAVAVVDNVGHELAHSYFGRGVMPANGNAGWIDEAMADFAFYGDGPWDLKVLNMGDHSPYFRANDREGYSQGVVLLEQLGKKFKKKDPAKNFNDFLKTWTKDYSGKVITNEILRASLEKYSGMNLKKTFDKYVYGRE